MYEVIFDVCALSRRLNVPRIFERRSIKMQGFPDIYMVVFNERSRMSTYRASDVSQSMHVFRVNPPMHVQEDILYLMDEGAPDDYIIERCLQRLAPSKNNIDPFRELNHDTEGKEEEEEGVRIDLFKTQFITIPNF